MQHAILFTSDIHGNEDQYRKLVDYAVEVSADSLIIGGDIAPKRIDWEFFITGQRLFLEEKLPSLLRPLEKISPRPNVFLMMGNDDCVANMDVLERNDPRLFRIIHGKRVKLTEDFDIVGYSFVPVTPFRIKDWEKYDLSEAPDNLVFDHIMRVADNYELHGCRSTEVGWTSFTFTSGMRRDDSIQKDLDRTLFCENPERTVFVFHTPPDNTNLDVGFGQVHLGSMALRLFIEKRQPYLTMHGHVHATVERSGDFKQWIGKTLCLTAGNDDFSPQLSVVALDLYDRANIGRLVI
jgi:Icc-related predicted phosphoesterase